jgi:hypothetical protein
MPEICGLKPTMRSDRRKVAKKMFADYPPATGKRK